MISKDFLSMSNSELASLHRYLSHVNGTEISKILKPCYVPKTIIYKSELFNKMGIEKPQIKEFKDNIDKKYRSFNILTDQYTLAIIMGMIHTHRKRRTETSKLLYQFLAIKFHSSLHHIFFPKFCSDELWKTTLNKVSSKHLYREKDGVSNAIIHVVNSLYKIYKPILDGKTIDDKKMVRMIYDLRHRLFQSMRSFATVYYDQQKKMGSTKTSDDVEEKPDVQIIADKISMSIGTFGQVDLSSLNLAISKSGIKRDIGVSIINGISDVEYKEQIKFIMILISRTGNLMNICKDSSRNALVRRIESGVKIGKYNAKAEMLKLMYSTELGYRLKGMYKTQLVIFLSHYLTNFTKTKIC